MKKKNRFVVICLLLAVSCSFSLLGKDSIVLRSKPHGMFSMFHFVLYFLQEYERNTIDGFRVDFAKTGLYYEEGCGPNWWEYYFEPISLGNCDSATVIEEDTYVDPNTIEFCNTLERNHDLVEKYIKVKCHVLQKVDDFQKSHFEGKYVIGVHYRGTDKLFHEAPRVAYDHALESIYKVIDLIPEGMDYRIFVATDELPFLQFMQYRFLKKVVYCKSKRSTNGTPIHSDLDRNPYQVGEEALIDALLLSRVDFLIRTSSNLSLCSRYFNPKLPVIELSQRKEEFIPCTEFYP